MPHSLLDFVTTNEDIHLYTLLIITNGIFDVSIVMFRAGRIPWAWSTVCETRDVPYNDTPTKQIPNQ
jgi:hypothetical protein